MENLFSVYFVDFSKKFTPKNGACRKNSPFHFFIYLKNARKTNSKHIFWNVLVGIWKIDDKIAFETCFNSTQIVREKLKFFPTNHNSIWITTHTRKSWKSTKIAKISQKWWKIWRQYYCAEICKTSTRAFWNLIPKKSFILLSFVYERAKRIRF